MITKLETVELKEVAGGEALVEYPIQVAGALIVIAEHAPQALDNVPFA